MPTYTSEFVAFAIGAGANVETPSVWSADTTVAQGFQAGTAQSMKFNTVLRQSSSIAAMIASFTALHGTGNVLDNGNIATLEAQFEAALKAAIGNPFLVGGTDSGSANTITITSVTPTKTALGVGDVVEITKSANTNTGGVTATVLGSTGAVQWPDGSALIPGAWVASTPALAVWNGSVFKLLSTMGASVNSPFLVGGTDAGSANVVTVSSVSPYKATLSVGDVVEITKSASSNTSTVSATVLSSTGSVVGADGSALASGEWVGSSPALAEWTGTVFKLLAGTMYARKSYADSLIVAGTTTNIVPFTYTQTWVVPAGVTSIKRTQCWGGGGGGGGSYGAGGAGSGGGGGGYAEAVNIAVTPGSSITVTVGSGGTPGSGAPTNGSDGGTSAFGSFCAAGGGGGGTNGNNILQNIYGGVSGVGITGQLLLTSQSGGWGYSVGVACGGIGGSSTFGGACPSLSVGTGGVVGSFPGGGGNGGAYGGGGGWGANGFVIIEY